MPSSQKTIVKILKEKGKIRSRDLEKICVDEKKLMSKKTFFKNLHNLQKAGVVKPDSSRRGEVYYVLITKLDQIEKKGSSKNDWSQKTEIIEKNLLEVFNKHKTFFIGKEDTKTQVFPATASSHEKFYDNVESPHQIIISIRDAPISISNKLIQNVKKFDEERKTRYSEKLKKGSEGYPRLINFDLKRGTGNVKKIFQLEVAPSKYGLSYLAEVTESNKKINLKEIVQLKKNHSLNSLAVRIGLVHKKKGKNYLIFHQRMPKENATYEEAWDVSAAGYINPSFHSEDGKTISPWLASKVELSEELTIPEELLPFRENYGYFGLIRNKFTGQLDIFGVATESGSYNIEDLNKNLLEKEEKRRVKKIKECLLNPDSIAKFISDAEYWVPTAVVTAVFILGAFGYTMKSIEKSFEKENVFKRIKIEPF